MMWSFDQSQIAILWLPFEGQFESLIELLSPSFHIIAFDRIGCGMSSKPTEFEAYHDVQIFADLCAIFERYIPQSSTLQDTKHEIMIIGHSFGCCQTVKLMAKYGQSPDHNFLVRAAILIGPPALILGHPMPWMPWAIFSLPHFILERMSSGLSASFRKSAIAPDSKKVHDLEETFAGWNKPSMYTSFYLQIDPVTEEQLKAFCQCGINTMVLHGAGDGLVSLDSINTLVDKMKEHREEEQMQNLVNMEVISKASHQCMQEDPLYVSKAIEQIWFRSTENTEITSQDDEES